MQFIVFTYIILPSTNSFYIYFNVHHRRRNTAHRPIYLFTFVLLGRSSTIKKCEIIKTYNIKTLYKRKKLNKTLHDKSHTWHQQGVSTSVPDITQRSTIGLPFIDKIFIHHINLLIPASIVQITVLSEYSVKDRLTWRLAVKQKVRHVFKPARIEFMAEKLFHNTFTGWPKEVSHYQES